MNKKTIDDCIEDIEWMLVDELREEKKHDSQIKVPTKAQQKKIAELALTYSPDPDEDEYSRAWETVEKEAREAAYKRAVKKAEREGLPTPIRPREDPFPKRTNGWRICFLKRKKEDEDFYKNSCERYGCLHAYYKTPSDEQVFTTLEALDFECQGWDSNLGLPSQPNVDTINVFVAKFDQLYPELRKAPKAKMEEPPSSSGCLIILAPIIGASLGIVSYLIAG